MRNILRPIFAIVVILSLMTGCTGTKHQCSEASAKIASTLSAVESGIEQASTVNVISATDTAAVLNVIVQATQVNDQFAAIVNASTSWDEGTKQAVLQAFNQLLNSVDALNAQGVLHIKDANTLTQFQAWMATIKISVTTLEGILVITQSSPAKASTFLFTGYRPHFA